MATGIAGHRPAFLLGVLAVFALVLAATLLWLPAEPAQAQEDTTRPTITAGPAITSSPASGDTYGEGETITVAVTFSETVTITGEPRVRLDVGERKRYARYSSADGATLTFTYTVKKVDADPDGIGIPKNAVKSDDGTIEDGNGNPARLKHPALADQAGHKVDGSPEEPAEPEPEPTPTPTPEPANSEPQFDNGDSATRSVDENATAGTNVGGAIAATDADGDALTYALTGSDAFAIGASTGQVTVAAALDHETQSSYTLTVSVSDGKNASGEADASEDDSITVTVSIGNVDEAGTVSLDPQTPQAGSPVSASLSDPDGGVSGETWSWAGSADGTDWTAIAGANARTYTPSADDAGKYLQATASYTDGHGAGKSASAATASAVVVPLPQITAGPVITSSPASGDTYGVDEAIVVAVTFSEAVTVTGQPRVRLAVGERQRWARYSGADGATLTFAYKVKKVDADANGVSIGADQLGLNGGSITGADGNAAVLSHPALADQSGHKVDGSREAPGGQQQQPPANSAPQFAADTATTLSVDENGAIGADVGTAIVATDADNDALTYGITGSDAFAIGASTGQITVASALDYETQASHSLTVTVSDGRNASGGADATVDASISVTVGIGNVDEAGVVSFDADRPQAGSPLTASLSDPDGGESGVAWTWASSANGTDWTAIAGASGASYTSLADDVGKYLQATVSYSDGHGQGKSASAATASAVTAAPEPEPPVITAGPVIVSNPESGDTYGKDEAILVAVTFSEAVTVPWFAGQPRVRIAVGERNRWARYAHSREDGTILVFAYKVKGKDLDEDGVSIRANQLHLNDGSIKDGDGNAAVLAHPALPAQAGHQVDGSQEAPAGGQQQQKAANRPPQFASDNATRSVDENAAVGARVGDAIIASDADYDTLTYVLIGSNAFTVDSAGQITVQAALDFETQHSYSLTVMVGDGKNAAGDADTSVDDTIAVTVNVGNVDEAGVVSFDANRLQAGSPLTASLRDLDGGESVVIWTWASSADGTDWTAIAGASGASYTPSSNDVGNYLKATASYTDGHGPGKSASGATTNPVAAASLTGYDSDNDGLISIANQEQLAAIALDLDGDGAPDSGDDGGKYSEAFPSAVAGMGCPEDTGCVGYELDGNLNLTGAWTPIGAIGAGFTGTFDGNGSAVSGLSIPSGAFTSGALFAELGAGGVIRNVGVIAPDINNGGDNAIYSSGLIGYNQGTVIESYVSDGKITAKTRGLTRTSKGVTVGGLVGLNTGTIRDSYASASVSVRGGYSDVGGLVGYNKGGTIINSYASGNVEGYGYSYIGGLVAQNTGAVRDSHASASASARGSHSEVGGLVGGNGRGGSVSNSRASGNVRAYRIHSAVGGLVGHNIGGSISNNYASGNAKATGGYSHVGGLVGQNERHDNHGGTVSNSHASGNASAFGGHSRVGGLVGSNNYDGTISNSYASGNASVNGTYSRVGGLVGRNGRGGSVSNSYSTGNANANAIGGYNDVGGLAGCNNYDGTISNSYASGNVSSNGKLDDVGGLAGCNSYDGTISNSYASGNVSSSGDDSDVGGLVAHNYDGTISHSYWDKEVAGVVISRGSPESAGKTTEEMKTATGPSSSIYTGWDTDIWDFSDTASYPTLR